MFSKYMITIYWICWEDQLSLYTDSEILVIRKHEAVVEAVVVSELFDIH